ncbi:MAG: hypothetical protein AB2818_16135 [Candidatus Thiodiazotropha sp.]
MKHQALVKEINFLLDTVEKKREKQRKKLRCYLSQVKAEKQKLRKKLTSESSMTNRKKLKKELNAVNKVYSMLNA